MSAGVWRLEDVAGVQLARCAALEAVPGIAHAFSTRVAFGRADFDLGPADGESEIVRWRRASLLRAAGLGGAVPAILRQVHGHRVVGVSSACVEPPEADGAVLTLPAADGAPIPAVRTADCVALLFLDRRAHAVAAIHAGWRGTAAGIAETTVRALEASGVSPRDLTVGLGPAILGCCYEVGDDVVSALEAVGRGANVRAGSGPEGHERVDLHAVNRSQLVGMGVRDEAIHAAPWCTRCRNDLFFSVRAEGAAAGRLMAVIGPASLTGPHPCVTIPPFVPRRLR